MSNRLDPDQDRLGQKCLHRVFSRRQAIKNQWHDKCFSIFILFFRPPLSS